MIEEIYCLKKPYDENYLKYLFKFPEDVFVSSIFIRALHVINKLSFNDNEELDGLRKIGKDTCIVIQSRDKFGLLHGIKIIKKLNRFNHEYEIRVDSKYMHIRILFFTLSNIFDVPFEGIVLSFIIEKYDLSVDSNSVIDSLCEDGEKVRKLLSITNYDEWISEV